MFGKLLHRLFGSKKPGPRFFGRHKYQCYGCGEALSRERVLSGKDCAACESKAESSEEETIER